MIYQKFEIECDNCGKSTEIRVPVLVDGPWQRKPLKGQVRVKAGPNEQSAESTITKRLGYKLKREHIHLCPGCAVLDDSMEMLKHQ